MMGLPIRELILATMKMTCWMNFSGRGAIGPRTTGETQQTSSPSMDISKASKFERFIFDLTERMRPG